MIPYIMSYFFLYMTKLLSKLMPILNIDVPKSITGRSLAISFCKPHAVRVTLGLAIYIKLLNNWHPTGRKIVL